MRLRPVLLFALVIASCGDEKIPEKENPVVASESDTPRLNRLAREKSPYLRQHAANPVDWYPWGDEAFAKAKEEDKPVFLSIGYSSCHWCHVMEHESFADEEVAAVLNEHYVCIKVDREERPDVDEIYMKAAMALMRGGGGGWPLSVWLTPDRKPFVAGTYFPKRSAQGMPGFIDVLQQIAAAWNDPQRRQDVVRTGDQVAEFLQETVYAAGDPEAIGLADVETAVGYVAGTVDPDWGGFGNEPKFPSPSTVELLLRAALRKRDPDLLKHVTSTLDHMARGGIHDHVGGGFHRYSVTRNWRVPHFEKMLYDNAQLLELYAWGYLVTGEPRYAATARDIARWVQREMTNEHGGFFSAQDADDPGGPEGEGGFYVWDPAEIRALFGEKEAAVVLSWFGVTDAGNWIVRGQQEKPGKTLLETRRTVAEVAQETGASEDEVRRIVDAAVAKMYERREQRPKPITDEKALAAWNGLMISGFARAYQALGDDDLLDSATRGGRFLREHMMRGGRLLRRWMEGEAAHAAVLDDYAYVISAFLDLYETTFDVDWLREALRLNALAVRLFYDEATGGFFYTGTDGEKLIARGKPIMDNARPAGNAVMVFNLLRIAELAGEEESRARAEDTIRFFGGKIHEAPLGMSHLLNAVAFAASEPREIFIAGDLQDPATKALIEAVWRDPDPNRVLALATPEAVTLLPPAAGKGEVAGRPAAYVCRGHTCEAPVTDPLALVSASESFAAEQRSGR